LNAGRAPAGAAGTDVLAPPAKAPRPAAPRERLLADAHPDAGWTHSHGEPSPIPAKVSARIEAALAGEAAKRRARKGVWSRGT
jgi:hypothetical protein